MHPIRPQSLAMSPRHQLSCHVVTALWLALADPVLGPLSASASEPQYELQGFMQLIDRSGKTNRFCDFWVAVSGQRSLIKVLYFNGESFVCGTDGIASYLLNEMRPATRQNGAGTYQFADISAGAFPLKAPSPVQLAWLSFASGGSLRKKDNVMPLEGFQEQAAFMRNEVVISTSPPHLPQSVKWWGPNFRVMGSTNEHMPLPAYSGGYLAGTYSIGATTNFGGNELPLEWKVTFNVPDFNKQVAQKEDVSLSQTLVATVTNLAPLAYHGDFLPSLGAQPIQFVEHRLAPRTGQAHQYPVINGKPLTHWPRRDDPYFKYLAKSASPLWRLW
jgi:hypothetical protein